MRSVSYIHLPGHDLLESNWYNSFIDLSNKKKIVRSLILNCQFLNNLSILLFVFVSLSLKKLMNCTKLHLKFWRKIFLLYCTFLLVLYYTKFNKLSTFKMNISTAIPVPNILSLSLLANNMNMIVTLHYKDFPVYIPHHKTILDRFSHTIWPYLHVTMPCFCQWT